MLKRIDYYKMDSESFKLWLIYLKTHPIIRTINANATK